MALRAANAQLRSAAGCCGVRDQVPNSPRLPERTGQGCSAGVVAR